MTGPQHAVISPVCMCMCEVVIVHHLHSTLAIVDVHPQLSVPSTVSAVCVIVRGAVTATFTAGFCLTGQGGHSSTEHAVGQRQFSQQQQEIAPLENQHKCIFLTFLVRLLEMTGIRNSIG